MPMLGFAEPPEYGPVPSDAACEHVYDVCIIGSGAAGSIAAHELVGAGFDVVMLDQGPFVTERVTFAMLNCKEVGHYYLSMFA
jgi:NADPH-dependent 2,4-dienoyl-CoA reductase/sulfur reductase-like enzyme